MNRAINLLKTGSAKYSVQQSAGFSSAAKSKWRPGSPLVSYAPPASLGTGRKGKKAIELPNHYLEVNYKTLKAVVFYGPNINHIPHDIKLKDLNLLLWSGKGRGQNI